MKYLMIKNPSLLFEKYFIQCFYLAFILIYFQLLKRFELRAKRFGVVSRPNGFTADNKLLERAKRFGLPVTNDNSLSHLNELEKLKKRADRFGETTSRTLESVYIKIYIFKFMD